MSGAHARLVRQAQRAFACVYCGARDVPLTFDHIVPLSAGGVNKRWNMASACGPCNRLKGDRVFVTLAHLERIVSTMRRKVAPESILRHIANELAALRDQRERERLAAGPPSRRGESDWRSS